MPETEKLVRKQHLIFPSHVEKLRLLAKAQKTSTSEMVRQAIDAFDPNAVHDMSESELLELARIRVKEAIEDTIATRKRVEATLDEIANRHASQQKVA